jgi:hypothetical protein
MVGAINMLKMHLCARVALALGVSAFIAGSASAASTSGSNSEFLDFFESIFDNDSNGGGGTAANLNTHDLNEVIQSVSVLGEPTEGQESHYGEPTWSTDDGRRVTDGGDGSETTGYIEVIEPIYPGTVECTPRRCETGGGTGGGAHPVPEPSAVLLFGLGALLVRRRLRR